MEVHTAIGFYNKDLSLTLQGILLVYDITSEKSFDDIKEWMANIEEVGRLRLESDVQVGLSRKYIYVKITILSTKIWTSLRKIYMR